MQDEEVTGFGDEEIPDIATQITANVEQRTPCILVLDCSGSMGGDPIEALNRALKAFEQSLHDDDIARSRVMIKIIAFGGAGDVQVVSDWSDAEFFSAPTLTANGSTPMGHAMSLAHMELDNIKQELKQVGISYTRPWIFLMSDGEPNDHGWEAAAQQSRQSVVDKKAVVWPIGMPGASASALQAFAGPDMQVYQAEATDFRELFVWLSASLSKAASVAPGEGLQIEAPTRILLEN